MYGLRYGTVPVVRRVGGLADTVRDASADAATGNGFVFDGAQPEALRDAIGRAFARYRAAEDWTGLMRAGMAENLSWEGPARRYMALYEQAHGARREALRRDID